MAYSHPAWTAGEVCSAAHAVDQSMLLITHVCRHTPRSRHRQLLFAAVYACFDWQLRHICSTLLHEDSSRRFPTRKIAHPTCDCSAAAAVQLQVLPAVPTCCCSNNCMDCCDLHKAVSCLLLQLLLRLPTVPYKLKATDMTRCCCWLTNSAVQATSSAGVCCC